MNLLWEVKVSWDKGEEPWEPVSELRKTDPITLSAYARNNDLSNIPGWK